MNIYDWTLGYCMNNTHTPKPRERFRGGSCGGWCCCFEGGFSAEWAGARCDHVLSGQDVPHLVSDDVEFAVL